MEPHPAMAPVLRAAGWQVDIFPTEQLCTAAVQHLPNKIEKGEYQLVWLTLPKGMPDERQRRRRLNAAVRELVLYIRRAHKGSTPAVLVGPVGCQWQHHQFELLLKDRIVNKSSHRLCHFGIKLLPHVERPDSSAFSALTTFSAEDS